MIAAIAMITEKRVLHSLRSHENNSSASRNDRWDRLQCAINDLLKPLFRDCGDGYDDKYILECTASLFDPGPLGHFIFCSDRVETGERAKL